MKNLNLLFTALLLLCCVGMAKAEDFKVNGIYYNILSSTDKTVEVTFDGFYYDSFNEYTGSVVIPRSVTYYGTTYSVTSIGREAFRDCFYLTSITIPNSVTSIGYDAFRDCSRLTSIRIPNSVTYIGSEALYNCQGLTSIVVDGNNTKYDSREDCNAIIKTETNTLIAGCKNTIIPNSVTRIGTYAFAKCTGLKSITIPNSVTGIGSSAFENCTGLKSITIPNSVTSIGDYAFNGCTSLKELRIEDGEGRLSLGYNRYNSDITGGKGLFYDCPLETLYLGRDLSYKTNLNYGLSPFYNIETLANVTIGNSVTSIGMYAFYKCTGLTSVVIGNSVTSIGYSAFDGCNGLTSIVIGNGVTGIGSYAFYQCSGLTSVVIGNSVTSIGNYAFEGCSNIETLYISSTIESIGIKAFDGCDKIKEIKVGAEKPIRVDENIFTDAVYDNATLYIPNGTKSLYEKREPWNTFFYIVEMDFTGIENVKAESGEVQTIYDLNGRAVENPTKGVYIIDGKKVLVK